MMQIKVTAPAQIHTTIQLPSSKSISNRALIINALGNRTFQLENLSDCDDTQVMIHALNDGKNTIDIMAAGTAMRFLTAYLSVTPGTRIITGTQRMQQRPIQVLVNALRELGAEIEYIINDGYPPLRITGHKLQKDTISLPGNVSSQYISALLMIAPILSNGLTLTLTGEIISRPYINLTLQLMNDFGARAKWLNEYQLKVEPQPYQSIPFYVESDWSAASYWYQIAALSNKAEIILPGLFETSYQGDSKVAEIFQLLGIESIYGNKTVTLKKTDKITERLVTYGMKCPKGLGIDNGTLFLCDEGLKVFNAKDPMTLMANQLVHYAGMEGYDVIPFKNTLMMIADDGLYQYDYSNLQAISQLSKLPMGE